ncbi:MAG: glycosyltransferase family 4 protein [Hyphomicrobium sp.]|nr:glycosyltransferase family 4 protein [Hyphomicrobium sp.]
MAKSSRILHVMRAPVGGLFRHVLDLSRAQAEQGHEVGLIADSNAIDALTDLKLADVAPHLALGVNRIHMGRKPGIGDFTATQAVAGVIRRLSPDVVHGHGAKGGLYARLATRLCQRSSPRRPRVFYTPHGGTLNFRPGTFEARVYLGVERVLAAMTSGIIFESDFARRAFADRIGLADVAWRVVPNGLRPQDFTPHTAQPDAADIVFIGELRDIKGVDVLLTAIAALNRDRTTTAVIVGSGPDGERLKGLAHSLGLADRVRFPGALPARDALPLGRLLVVPSLKESFPYVVLEGAAAGLPLVATDVGGIPEIVRGTDTSLIPAGDAKALRDALAVAVSERDAALARARRLRETVASQFTVERMTRDILGFYAEAKAA